MTLQTANPFPTEGLRKLTPKEMMQRAKALNCTVPKDNKPNCTAQINVGIFFDGTGNNMKADFDNLPPEKRKHSNVVRLYQAYEFQQANYFRYYIPGVGTAFPEIGDSGGIVSSMLGGGGSLGVEQRITWAFTQLLNAPHQYLFNTPFLANNVAATLSSTMAYGAKNMGASRRFILNNQQDKLKAALAGKKPQLTQINLSVFGFSRGAAEARAFCNWLFEVCEAKDGGYTFAGIPIRLQFLGIFDTVASVGATDLFDGKIVEGRQSWADHNMGIHPAIEQCVHFVAGHEVRACFPLDSARDKQHYPANVKEVMYPGAHSDVGGGYAPNALGVSPEQDSFMATIAAANMYKEARLAGVPLIAWDDLTLVQRKNFTASPQTISDFNAYLNAVKLSASSVEAMHKQHMSLYLSYRYKYRNALKTLSFYQRADAKNKGHLRTTTDTFNKRLKVFTAYPVPPEHDDYDIKAAAQLQKDMAKAMGMTAQDEAQHGQLYKMIESIDVTQLTPAIEHFFEHYVHDSMAGFLEKPIDEFMLNGHGIMRFRTIFAGD